MGLGNHNGFRSTIGINTFKDKLPDRGVGRAGVPWVENRGLDHDLSSTSQARITGLEHPTPIFIAATQNFLHGCPEDHDHLIDRPLLYNKRGHQTNRRWLGRIEEKPLCKRLVDNFFSHFFGHIEGQQKPPASDVRQIEPKSLGS
jgi:hypothetical protein